MFQITSIAKLVATISALAIAQEDCNEPTTGGVLPPFPIITDISYFQGTTASESSTCGVEVSNGTIQADQCNSICTAGISIAQAPNNQCTFTLFSGSSSCGAKNGGEKGTYQIPAGEGSTCVGTGVEDDCSFQSASGVWSCH